MKRFRDRPKRRDATRTSARGTGRGGSCECENFLERLSPRLRLFPHYGPHRMQHGGEIANPFLPLGRGQFRLLADEEGSDGSRCYGNRRKASPGIVRNNYPALNSARSRALRVLLFFPLSLSLSLSRFLYVFSRSFLLLARSQIVYADKNSPTTIVASLSIANCF